MPVYWGYTMQRTVKVFGEVLSRDCDSLNDDQTMQVDYVTLWFDRTANADE